MDLGGRHSRPGANWLINYVPTISSATRNILEYAGLPRIECIDVRGEPVFSGMAAGWFCEKSG